MEYILLYKKHWVLLELVRRWTQHFTKIAHNWTNLHLEPGRGRGGRVLLYNGLMGMCRWMGSHFHGWIDNNGVPFSIVTRMGSHIFGFFAGYLAWENRRHFATPPPVSPAQIGELARRLVKVGHTTGVYVPYSFRTVVWVILRPTRTDQWKCCETGPTSFRPYPRRLESLTIYRCHYKCSTFF